MDDKIQKDKIRQGAGNSIVAKTQSRPFHHVISEFILRKFRNENGQVSVFRTSSTPPLLAGRSTGTFGGDFDLNLLSNGSYEIEKGYSAAERRAARIISTILEQGYFANGSPEEAELHDFMRSLSARGENFGREPKASVEELYKILRRYPGELTTKFGSVNDANIILTSTTHIVTRYISNIMFGEEVVTSIMTFAIPKNLKTRFIISDRGPIEFSLPLYLSMLTIGTDNERFGEVVKAMVSVDHSYMTTIDIFLPISPTMAIASLSAASTRLLSNCRDKMLSTTEIDSGIATAGAPIILHRDLDEEEVRFFNHVALNKSYKNVLSHADFKKDVADAADPEHFPTLVKLKRGEYQGRHPYAESLIKIGFVNDDMGLPINR
jgi:hypothetical protein